MDLQKITRPNIWNLKPYSCARDEFKGEASVYLDANESPYNGPYNRYPDPLQWAVKEKIGALRGVRTEQIFLGVGSDEAIDLMYRAFCEPSVDNVVTIEPTYGMYGVCAGVNNVEYRAVKLREDFSFSADDLLAACDAHTKLVWLCSPNNPTGNNLQVAEVIRVLDAFEGLVVVDEAYVDFSGEASWVERLRDYENLVVLQTFSKAWASAAVRLGMAFASEEIIAILNKIKYPYNVNILTQEHALKMLDNVDEVQNWVKVTLQERAYLVEELGKLACVLHIYPTDANFVLCRVVDANGTYKHLVEQGIIVRNRHSVTLCEGCLRITVGTREENEKLIEAVRS